MGLGGWIKDTVKAGGIQGIGGKVSGKSNTNPMPQNQIQNSIGMMNNMIQGKNPYGGKTNQHPQAAGQQNPSINSAPQGMPTPGKNGYTPTTAPYGMDQSNPGVQEQFWNQNQNLWLKGAFQGPGQGEQFWNQVQGNFNTNNNLQPQFDAAYDRSRDKAVGAANQQAAARGVYGSSAALNNVGNVIGDFESNRAKAATDFALANAANQRANLGQYGNLAFQAQDAGMANRAFDLGALGQAYGAAGSAQDARRARTQDAFGNTAAMAGMYMPFLQNNYDQLLGTDMSLVTGATQAGPAATAQALAQQSNNRQQISQDFSNALGIYGAYNNAKR